MARATMKVNYFCNGGPYDKENLPLTTPSTLVFTAKGMKGKYVPSTMSYLSDSDLHEGVNGKLVPVSCDKFFGTDLIWEGVK